MQFNGLTPLGTNLNNKVIQPFLASGVNGRNLAKPILVRFTFAAASDGFLHCNIFVAFTLHSLPCLPTTCLPLHGSTPHCI